MSEPITAFYGAQSDPGQRPNNEDYYTVVDVEARNLMIDGLMLVADGMGGRNYGEAASVAAVETVEEILTVLLRSDQKTPPSIQEAFENALRNANTKVQEMASESPEHEGMGTTCVSVILCNNQLHVAHVGDSRAYILKDNELIQITEDHSFVAEQVRAGTISKAGAKRSRFRNVITRAVGIEDELTPDYEFFDLDGIYALLLCTDGLTNVVEDSDIAHILAYAPTPQDAADLLVAMANTNGSNDNITAVVARFGKEGPLDDPVETVVNTHPAERKWADYKDPNSSKTRIPLVILVVAVALLVIAAAYIINQGYHFTPTAPFFTRE